MPVTFDNDEEALQALQHNCALADLSHWDRLHISGKDRLAFLHGQVHVHPQNHPTAFRASSWHWQHTP